MAKLTYKSLSLEIKYVGFKAGDVQYEIAFLWEGESMINDALLKRNTSYWSSRSKGAFLANEFEKDSLIETIEKVLESNESDYWEPCDPDVTIAIYPEMFFPFLKSHYEIAWMSEKAKRAREEYEREKMEKGRLPDDPFTVIAFVDAYNFRNSTAYCGSGIALNMIVERKDVETFCSDLKKEYAEFKEKFKVDEYKPEYKMVE